MGFLKLTSKNFFEVVIQAGAILAVLVIYIKTILHDYQLMKKVMASFIPTALVGLILYKVIKDVFFENYLLQLAVFILVGIVFIAFEYFNQKRSYKRAANQINYKEAVMVGLAQSLAVIPGVSRAGSVIIAMMALNVKRDESAKYSFLLALPTIVAASALDIIEMRHLLIGQLNNSLILLLGLVAAFFSALFMVRWLISYLQRNTITIFGWYRIIIGIILAFFVR